jgi:pathogenesis-related protein 1
MVAAYAQAFATKRKGDCTLVHSGGPYGENLFWGSAGGNIFLGAGGSDAWDALNSWIGQKQYYDCSTNSCRSREACGDYTQLAWANSTRVGCASVACDAGGTFIACNYDPPGNVPGQRPYLGCATADINPPGMFLTHAMMQMQAWTIYLCCYISV